MTSNAANITRLIRGIMGVVLIIGGIMDNSWIGLPGVLLLMSGITGRCGFGAASCEIKPQGEKKNE
jgi:hypothetical protein